jgi:DNA-binding MarR family transcriptional regulator
VTSAPRTIRQAIRQTRPFRTVQAEAVVSLLHTADLMGRHLARGIEPGGVTLQQYNVLRILRGAGPEGIPTLEIAERMIEQTPGITRLLDRLEAKHLVHRERCPTDRRQVTCRISPTGLSLLARLDPAVESLDHSALAGLTKAETSQLVRLLDQLRAGLDGTS